MITVLMATYQGKKYLEQQLDSILAQTVPVRILISDDGSADGTRQLLEQYCVWYPEQVFLAHRPGTASAANPEIPPAAQNFFWLMSQAAQEGQSDYIMLSDQDDVWLNHKVKRLEERMKELEEELGADHPILVHSDMEVADESMAPIHSSFFAYQHCDPERTSFGEVLVENPVTGGALMMNRALLELVTGKSGQTEKSEKVKKSEKAEKSEKVKFPAACCMHDWWIALAASCFGTIDCVAEPLYRYRQHEGNTLGAKATGSISDIRDRLGRRQQVRENYRRMLAQAVAFGRRYGKRMDGQQKAVLRAFLSLPDKSPSERMQTIREYHLYKSSLLQIFAMCVTMPRVRHSEGYSSSRLARRLAGRGAGRRRR